MAPETIHQAQTQAPSLRHQSLPILPLYNTTAINRSFTIATVKLEASGNAGRMDRSRPKKTFSTLLIRVALYLHKKHITQNQVLTSVQFTSPTTHVHFQPGKKKKSASENFKTSGSVNNNFLKRHQNFVNQTINNSPCSPGRKKTPTGHDFLHTTKCTPPRQKASPALNAVSHH